LFKGGILPFPAIEVGGIPPLIELVNKISATQNNIKEYDIDNNDLLELIEFFIKYILSRKGSKHKGKRQITNLKLLEIIFFLQLNVSTHNTERPQINIRSPPYHYHLLIPIQ